MASVEVYIAATFMLLLDRISTTLVINIKKPKTFVKVDVINLEIIHKNLPFAKKPWNDSTAWHHNCSMEWKWGNLNMLHYKGNLGTVPVVYSHPC